MTNSSGQGRTTFSHGKIPGKTLVLLVAALVAALVWHGRRSAVVQNSEKSPPTKAVSLAGPLLIAVESSSPLERKLEITTVRNVRVHTPLLTVTGAVMAKLRSGPGSAEDRWQFSTVELSGIFADWEHAETAVEFTTKQLTKTRELTAAQLASQARAVDRLRKLVATGTEAVRDLTAAEASLLQLQLTGQKNIFEAESALTQATHSHADLRRRLLQAGVDPALLEKAKEGSAMVMADVPEVRLGLVALGQSCDARFYGLPGKSFKGTVRSLAPALSTERRTLRVFFELDDRESLLRPGMYAEIGLGTDPRQAVLVPADGVLHIGGADYVLTGAGEGLWRVTEVQVGERAGESIEILGGLTGGEPMVGVGAILLKPLVVQSLLEAKSPASATPSDRR